MPEFDFLRSMRDFSVMGTQTSFGTVGPIGGTNTPVGTGKPFVMEIPKGMGNAHLLLMGYGDGGQGSTFDSRYIVWEQLSPPLSGYVPRRAGEIQWRLSTNLITSNGMSSVAGTHVLCDESVVVQGPHGNEGTVSWPRETLASGGGGDAFGAWARVPVYGGSYVEFLFDMTGATGANFFFRFV